MLILFCCIFGIGSFVHSKFCEIINRNHKQIDHSTKLWLVKYLKKSTEFLSVTNSSLLFQEML